MYPSIENFVGNTSLVQLKRIPGDTSNVILAKLEGNNSAGSVKDRPALSMIVRAEQQQLCRTVSEYGAGRGEICGLFVRCVYLDYATHEPQAGNEFRRVHFMHHGARSAPYGEIHGIKFGRKIVGCSLSRLLPHGVCRLIFAKEIQ